MFHSSPVNLQNHATKIKNSILLLGTAIIMFSYFRR